MATKNQKLSIEVLLVGADGQFDDAVPAPPSEKLPESYPIIIPVP